MHATADVQLKTETCSPRLLSYSEPLAECEVLHLDRRNTFRDCAAFKIRYSCVHILPMACVTHMRALQQGACCKVAGTVSMLA